MEQQFMLHVDDLDISCRLTRPMSGEARHVVLGVHGITGSADDEIQTSIAEEMALFGAAMFRFDFPAHGQSPVDSAAFTLENCKKTLITVAAHAKEQYPEVENLCIFATGFGAYVTLVSLEALLRLPGKIRLVIQTPSVRMAETLLSMTRKSVQTLRVEDHYTFKVARPLTVNYSLYQELKRNVAMDSYPIPMLILQGEKDDYINMDDIQNFKRINEDSKLVVIPGASHRFEEEGAWEMVLDLTRDWFEFEQVLLSDWY